jgi:hypothetical protein
MARKTAASAKKAAPKAASKTTKKTPRKAAALAVEYWPIERLRPYERNPRKNDAAVPQMIESIKAFGFAIPVLAQSDGLVIDGHLRLKAATAMKLATVPVIPCDGWSDAQVKAFRLMVNRSVSWADWDTHALAAEFADLKALNFDLTLTGFDPADKEMVSFLASGREQADTKEQKTVTCPKCGHEFTQ